MKKLFILLISILAIAPIVSAEDNAFFGTWYLNYLSMDKKDMINPKDVGYSATLQINEEGFTFEDSEDMAVQGMWEQSSDTIMFIPIYGEKYELSLQDDFLILDQDGGYYYFKKDQNKEAAFDVPPVKNDANPEDFEGDWTVVKICIDGMFFDWDIVIDELEAIGVRNNIVTIKNGILHAFDMDELYRLHDESNGVMAYRNNSNLPIPESVLTFHEENIITLEYRGATFVLQK